MTFLTPIIGYCQIIISEDFSDNGATWYEYDPDSKISFNQRLDFVNWIRTDEGYVHKPIEPVSNFKLKYDFNLIEKWGNAKSVGPFISDVEGSITDLQNAQGNGVWLQYYAGYGVGKVYIQPFIDGVGQTNMNDVTRRIPVDLNTVYYVTLIKEGNLITLNIYSDPNRTINISGSPISVEASLSSIGFNHFYATNSQVAVPPNNPEWSTGWIDNIELSIYNSAFVGQMYSKENITIYPNPFKNAFSITSEITRMRIISIFNSSGQKIYTGKMKNNQKSIDLTGFKKGLYFVVLTDENGIIKSSEKIVKK